MNSLYISTTGTNVDLVELGTTIVHPTNDMDLYLRFTSEEVRLCSSLTIAIQSGTLQWRKVAGGPVQLAADYDPDFLEIEELAEGQDDEATQLVRRRGFRTSVKTTSIDIVEPYTIAIAIDDFRIHRLIDGKASYTTRPVVTLPDATTLDEGHEFFILNESLGNVVVRDGAGNDLIDLDSKRLRCEETIGNLFVVVDNSTVAGTWSYRPEEFRDYDIIYNYNGIDTDILDSIEFKISGTNIRKHTFNRTGDDVTSEIIELFDTDGMTVLKTITLSHTYDSNNKLLSSSRNEA